MDEAAEAEAEAEIQRPIFRDIRRYYCEYCGICRSKKSLLTSHLLSHHKEQLKDNRVRGDGKTEGEKSNACEECGASFKKPTYLKQHMLSHSLERSFTCSVEDCHTSYRRKDHLTRHLLRHQGKLFKCPVESCNSEFAFQSNMKRHVKEFHDDDDDFSSTGAEDQKHICPEIGCGKVFKYASRLQKHENSHVKLEATEGVCLVPGCMKYFTNDQCLRDHIQSCHLYVTCEICGTKQLKKNMKRHLSLHEAGVSSEKIKCTFEGCLHTFTKKSNLHQHVKAVHLDLKPFACSFPGCGMRFSYKHVRDKHEKTGRHLYTHGDFEELDELFQERPRGGRKRKFPTIETLTRKRIAPPSSMDPMFDQIQEADSPASDHLASLRSKDEDQL